MSTNPPPLIAVGPGDAADGPATRDAGHRLWAVAVLVLLTSMVQVSVLPWTRLMEGSPDVMAGAVVAVALLRGQLVGAVAGFAGGLLIELTAPVGTLGAYALLYLIVGAVAGRYCEREESYSVLPALVMNAAAVAFVQLGYALLQVMLGGHLLASDFARRVIVPTLVLSTLLFPVVLLVARKLLGAPRNYEPRARL